MAYEAWEEARKFIETLTTGPLITFYVVFMFRRQIAKLIQDVSHGSLTVGQNKVEWDRKTVRLVAKKVENAKLLETVLDEGVDTTSGQEVDEGDESIDEQDEEDDEPDDDSIPNDDSAN
jgi:hypothetical protein